MSHPLHPEFPAFYPVVDLNAPSIQSFLRVAGGGATSKGSTGEQLAYALARGVSDLGSQLMSLDSTTRAGYLRLLEAAADVRTCGAVSDLLDTATQTR